MAERLSSFPFHLDDLLLDIIRQAQQILPFDSGGLLLFDPANNSLMPHAYLLDSALRIPSIPLGEGIIGLVAGHQRAERIPDMRADPRARFIDPNSRSEIAAPVMIGDELLGVFNLESRQPDSFSQSDLQTLQVLAQQAAVIIQLARRYQGLATQHTLLSAATELRQRETEALLRLATITSSTLNLSEMLTNAVRESAELLDCEGAQLLLPDHIAYVLNVHEASVYGIAQSWPVTAWPLDGIGYLIDAYHTGQTYYANTPPPDAEANCRNVIVCPLNFRLRTMGVLHLINRRSGDVDEEHVALAQAIANQMAASLSSAQSFAAEHHRAEMMSQINNISQKLYTILDPDKLVFAAAQFVHEMFGHDAVYIYLLSDDKTRVTLSATDATSPRLKAPEGFEFPATQGVVGRVIRTGMVQNVSDLRDDEDYVWFEEPRRLQSCIMVPLRCGDDVCGALELASTQINAFSNEDRDALETIIIMVGTALQNARLHTQAQRRLMEQSIVHQIGQDLTAILNYSELAQALVEHMNRALATASCIVGLYEPKNNSVRVEAEYYAPDRRSHAAPSIADTRLNLSEHASLAEAIAERRPVIVYASDHETEAYDETDLEADDYHSELILPMAAGERVLGVVRWTDTTFGRRFTREDVNLAQTLVSQATIAVDNALLFRQLENRAFELSEANRLRSQFLATISHELRTPMNSIIGFSETLLNNLYGDLNEQQASRMERIQRNGYNLLTLIDDLLDLSKIDAGRMKLVIEPVSVHDAITSATQSIEHQVTNKGLELRLEVEPDVPHVSADPDRLHQIITNLVSNAIKFTHEGTITIICRRIERQGHPMVQTTVSDTGIGIAKGNQSMIFDEFRQVDGSSTRAYGGTGLGLAISKKLVEMMKGAIWVESEVNQGSHFHFILPVSRPDAKPQEITTDIAQDLDNELLDTAERLRNGHAATSKSKPEPSSQPDGSNDS